MSDNRPAFNFHRDFSKSHAASPFLDVAAQMPVPHAQHVQALEQARQESYNQGVADGRQAQMDAEAARLSGCLDGIASRLQIAMLEMKQVEEKARQEALEFASLFARKIAGRLIENAPMQPIEATARAIFNDLRGSAHVAVRVAPSLVDACKSRLTLLMRENGLEPKLFVFPDPDVAIGDCRIEWADGGIVRERAKLDYLIDKALDMLLPRQAH